MAIIIPSKNIYEINNQKVVDNEVDKIEVSAKNASIISDTKIVYNERINSSAKDDDKQSHYTHNERTISGMGTQNYTAVAYVEETPKYDTVTITIPKHIGNAGVLRILTGANEDGIENIKYSLRGTTKKGNVTGTSVCASSVVSGVSFESIALNEPTNVETKTDTQYSFSPNVDYTYDFHFAGAEQTTVSATENFVLSNKSNTLTAQTRDSVDGENFIIDLIFLSGTIIKKVGGGGLYVLGGSTNINLSGGYEEYIPTQIDVSFYGDTISLDLQEKTVKIGDGQHVYSFNGNELMQKTNTPTIEETYNNVIKEWRNGKECATLLCAIDNYYEKEIKNIDIEIQSAIDVSVIKQEISVTFRSDKKILTDEDCFILINKNKCKCYHLNEQDDKYTYFCTIRDLSINDIIVGNIYTANCKTEELIISPYYKAEQMTFNIGNIVVPYMRAAHAKDKPMSLYSDGNTAKQFVVIGKNISYGGFPQQEIILQEIKKHVKAPVVNISWEEKTTAQGIEYELSVTVENPNDYSLLLNGDVIVNGSTTDVIFPSETRFEKQEKKSFSQTYIVSFGQIVYNVVGNISFYLIDFVSDNIKILSRNPYYEEETTTTTTPKQDEEYYLTDKQGDWELYSILKK